MKKFRKLTALILFLSGCVAAGLILNAQNNPEGKTRLIQLKKKFPNSTFTSFLPDELN